MSELRAGKKQARPQRSIRHRGLRKVRKRNNRVATGHDLDPMPLVFVRTSRFNNKDI
jgi:hypothetical protein